MRKRWMRVALATLLVLAGGSTAAATERFDDAVGDVVGDAPDIVAVTVSEPDEGSLIRFEIEFTRERPFGTDMDTWTDGIFVLMADQPALDERGILAEGHYLTGTHGITLPMQEQTGAFLLTPTDMYTYVVDVDSAGPLLVFTFDRKLMEDPRELHFQVLVGTERDGAPEGAEPEGDMYPDEGEAPAYYALGLSGR